MPDAIDFQKELTRQLEDATTKEQPFLDVRFGDLHEDSGGKTGKDNRIVVCCGVMYSNLKCHYGDEILRLPTGDSGIGMNLVIRYMLPRPMAVL
jgi:hypothetical protein